MKFRYRLRHSGHAARPVPRFAVVILALSIPCYASYAIAAPMAFPLPFDFAINYSAATLLRTRAASIYDRDALRRVHDERIGDSVDDPRLHVELFATYINPPTTALLHVPFTLLPFPLARIVFLVLSNVLYVGAIWLLLRTLRAQLLSAEGIMASACALTLFPISVSYVLGQVDAAIILTLTLALMASIRHRDACAGALIAAAAAVKVSPALALAFFLAHRRLSALKGALVAGALIALATTALAGPASLLEFAAQVLPRVSRGSALYENQSLLAAIYRLTLPPSVVKTEIESVDAIADYPLQRLLWAGLSLALLATTFVLVRRARLDRRELVAIAFGAFILIGVLGGSIAWDHYAVWLLIPVIGLVIDWFRNRWLTPRIFWPAFVLGMIAVNFPALLQLLLYETMGPFMTSLGTYGMLILLALLWARLRCRDIESRQ